MSTETILSDERQKNWSQWVDPKIDFTGERRGIRDQYTMEKPRSRLMRKRVSNLRKNEERSGATKRT